MNTPLVIVSAVVFTVLLPLLAVCWVVAGRSGSKAQLLVKTLASATALTALYLASVWPMTWYYLRYLFPLLFVAAATYAWWQAQHRHWAPSGRLSEWLSIAASVVVLGVSGYLAVDPIGASDVPQGAVEVEFPFESGAFYVAHGGSRPAVNAHIGARDRTVHRGQVWALDIVQIDWLGRRTRGLYPANPARYHIFGTTVVAPCSGRITAVKNNLPDLGPPDRDMVNLAGNYVQIACEGGFYLILAHLQRCSIQARVGEMVAAGDRLGVIGNSGNTSEPHLHIHAQAGPGRTHLLDADPVPLVFHGHGWLTRNDVVRVRRSGSTPAPRQWHASQAHHW